MLRLLIIPLIALTLSATSVLAPGFCLSELTGQGSCGLSGILYAYTSATVDNGSAFGGLNANTQWYNITLGIAMSAGRFLMIVPMLAVAGSLVKKRRTPASPGTFPVTTPLFTALLTSVILIVGALTFIPALSLGPVLEHLMMHAGRAL